MDRRSTLDQSVSRRRVAWPRAVARPALRRWTAVCHTPNILESMRERKDLATSHEAYDFQRRAERDRDLAPPLMLDHAAIEFHGDLYRLNLQQCQQGGRLATCRIRKQEDAASSSARHLQAAPSKSSRLATRRGSRGLPRVRQMTATDLSAENQVFPSFGGVNSGKRRSKCWIDGGTIAVD